MVIKLRFADLDSESEEDCVYLFSLMICCYFGVCSEDHSGERFCDEMRGKSRTV